MGRSKDDEQFVPGVENGNGGSYVKMPVPKPTKYKRTLGDKIFVVCNIIFMFLFVLENVFIVHLILFQKQNGMKFLLKNICFYVIFL